MNYEMINCEVCGYWKESVKEGIGECRKVSPSLDPHGRGVWPETRGFDGCYSGKYVQKEMINE